MNTRASLIVVLTLLLSPLVHAADWELEYSVLTYHVNHPMHHVEGVSRAARGKGRSDGSALRLLVAVPVKSFDSGDSNRDSHMVEATRGALHPMIVVHITAPLSAESATATTVTVAAAVDFSGTVVGYAALPLYLVSHAADHIHATGTMILSMKAFGIIRPSLLAIPIEDEVPVDLDLTWRRKRI